MADYDIVESKKVFEGAIFDVFHEKIILPNGKSAMREIVKKNHATAAVPVMDDGKIILVKQYRPAIKAFALEIPAGIFDAGENAEQ